MTRDVIEQFEEDGAAIVRDALPLFWIERVRVLRDPSAQ
jgi:hypothetical protein